MIFVVVVGLLRWTLNWVGRADAGVCAPDTREVFRLFAVGPGLPNNGAARWAARELTVAVNPAAFVLRSPSDTVAAAFSRRLLADCERAILWVSEIPGAAPGSTADSVELVKAESLACGDGSGVL